MTFTKEQLIEKLQHRISVASGFTESEKAQMDLEMARIALASLTAPEQEPVYQACKEAGVWVDIDAQDVDSLRFNGEQIRKVYTAPPAPVSAPAGYRLQPISEYDAMCAAMLQGAAGNSPVIPEGWKLVPVGMTAEQMRAVQINSELGAYAAAELTGAYSLFREFWDVAVAAAPQQEVKNG